MTFNWEFNIGHIVTILTVGFAIVSIFISMRYSLISLKTDVVDLEIEIKKINEILTMLAIQKTEMNNIAEKLERLERWYDELRRGEGYVFPLESHLPKGS